MFFVDISEEVESCFCHVLCRYNGMELKRTSAQNMECSRNRKSARRGICHMLEERVVSIVESPRSETRYAFVMLKKVFFVRSAEHFKINFARDPGTNTTESVC